MRRITVSSEQRFTTSNPCPVCSGGKDMPQGLGQRCAGFLSSDGRYAHCTREEHAGNLDLNQDTTPATYAHLVDGECRCGLPHGVGTNGRGPTSTPVARVRRSRSRERPAKDGALDWLATYTGVPRKVWEELGVEADDNGLLFLFEGRDAVKRRGIPKTFSWDMGGPADAPVWPVPASELPDTIWLTTGETDCGTVRHAGLCAFAITAGEKATKAVLTRAHYRALMRRGVQGIVICPDADEVGQGWGRHEAKAAALAGLDVSIVDLTPLYDPFGGGVKDLNDLYQASGSVKAFRARLEERTTPFAARDAETWLDEFLEVAENDVRWLIEDLIASGEIILIAAPQKSLKTWFMVVLVRALATGGTFLQAGWKATGTYRVLIIEEEGNEVKFAQRLKTANFTGPVAIRHRKGSDLTSPDFINSLIERIKKEGFDVLVLDALQRMAPDVNENDAGEMGRVWDNIHRLARECPELVVVLVHHFNKGAALGWHGIKGSSRTAGEVDVAFFLEKQEGGGLKLALDGRDIPRYLDVAEALDVSVEINPGDRLLEMEVQGTVRIKARRVSKVRAAIEVFLKGQGENLASTAEVYDAVVGAGVEVTSREAVLKHLRGLTDEGNVVGAAHGPRGAKGWKWAGT